MVKHSKDKQTQAVDAWWNQSRNQKKWGKEYEEFQTHGSNYLKSRQQAVLKYVGGIEAIESACILELGYGGGQTALELGKLGHKVYGLDISKKLRDSASERCVRAHPEGKFDLRVGNIESEFEFSNEMFDVVVVVGALQYLHCPEECLKEVHRVLKPGGYFIVAQRNIYSLSNLTSLRYFFRSMITFLFREQYELFPSYKSILTDSKLGSIFKPFKDSRLFNTRFMMKGHDVWKFKIKKRVNSYRSLKKSLKKQGFSVLGSEGAYIAFSEMPSMYVFNVKFAKVFSKLTQIRGLNFMSRFGRSIVFLTRKGE